MFILMKLMMLTISICADIMSRMYSVLMLRIKISMKIIFKLNSYIILLDILFITFLLLLKLNCINSRLFNYLITFNIIFK